MKLLKVKNTLLGDGVPKIIFSLMDGVLDDALETLELAKKSHVDCIEYRGDWSLDVMDLEKMKVNAHKIRAALPDHALLFTFRSIKEGGHRDVEVDYYVELNNTLIKTGCLDMVDVESWIGDENVKEIIHCAHQHSVKVINSYHNFDETPSQEWMVSLMKHMKDLGADIPKVAVMPKNAKDVLALLAATDEMVHTHGQGPVLTMSMGKPGVISRISGELFGSCLTFCAMKAASAPGQVKVNDAHEIMQMIHNYMQ